MRKIGVASAQVDAANILVDDDNFLVVPATIAREGVYPYPEGEAFKPAQELEAAAWTADGAWIVPEEHPDTLIVTSPDQVVGRVEQPFFCSDVNSIKAHLRFFKKRANPQFLADIKAGRRRDVSIGFFYEYDPTPGKWSGKEYDFVQRKILIDHVAAGVLLGRCTSPYCGIAVDSVIMKKQVVQATPGRPSGAADPISVPENFRKNEALLDPAAEIARAKRLLS